MPKIDALYANSTSKVDVAESSDAVLIVQLRHRRPSFFGLIIDDVTRINVCDFVAQEQGHKFPALWRRCFCVFHMDVHDAAWCKPNLAFRA